MARLSSDVEATIQRASREYGISPDWLRAFVRIESGGNPNATTGSYRGLLQLSNNEFNKYGGGNIYSIDDNLRAGALKLKAEAEDFKRKYGHEPTAGDLYLIHQQGSGGAAAHWSNPDQPAWKSMAGTAEGRQKGEAWAKQAIWGNIPDNQKVKFGSVDNVTSGQFAALWNDKVKHFGESADDDAARQGSINGGYGNSPTGSAGISGPIQTADPVSPDTLKVFNDTGPAKPKETLVAGSSAPMGGDAGGLLAGLFGDGGNVFQSLMSSTPPPAPKVETAEIPTVPVRQVDPAQLLAIVQRRQKLGSA